MNGGVFWCKIKHNNGNKYHFFAIVSRAAYGGESVFLRDTWSKVWCVKRGR